MRTFTRQQQLDEMKNLVASLMNKFTPDVIRAGFICGGLNDELSAIGRLALNGRQTEMMPEHILVWTGYEVATESKYQDW